MTTAPPTADRQFPDLPALLAATAAPADAFLALGRRLYGAGRFAEGEQLTARAVEFHPQAPDLWNLHGVFLRMLRRQPEAFTALDNALALAPQHAGALVNRGNVALDLGDAQGALDTFARLLRLDPNAAPPRNMVGRALARLGRYEEAIVRFREAVALKPDFVESWLELASAFNHLQRPQDAETTLTDALEVVPDHPKLLEGKALLLRVTGRRSQARAFLTDLAARMPDVAWIQFHLGDLLIGTDPGLAIGHLRRALALQPDEVDHTFVLLQALGRSITGDEGANLDEAYGLARRVSGLAGLKPAQTVLLRDIFARACAFDDLEALGSFEALGRSWALADLHGALMCHIAQATTPERRSELLHQHRLWGRAVEANAQRAPIRKPAPRAPRAKIRVGFMSSDLRAHAVGYFALPLFEHIDRSRFEVFVYSYYLGSSDALQARVKAQVDGYRWWPEITAHEAAQKIAEDDLDMLIELGGSTHMNKLEVMAYRPAPLQASWLGYPHSAGLSTLTHFICDSHNQPADPGLMVEQPLLMPKSWVAISPILRSRLPDIDAQTPEARKGRITYGTANNTYKDTREVLAAWARVVAATPGAHFAFVRPEGGSAVFRANVEAAFAAEGVSADRIDWHVTRGGHLAAYNEIDISLDTFPLTGGTTTVEALMMGVPVVSLVGEAFYERLSYSILCTAGLEDLCAFSPEDFQAVALKLAADPARRTEVRRTLRADLEASALGQTDAFARDFYDMVERAVRDGSRTAG